MDNSLVNRETLEQVVDSLLAQKFPEETPANFSDLREASINTLDARITTAIFGQLSDEQLYELNRLFDNNESDPQVFQNFFAKANINLEQTIAKAVQDFATEFRNGEIGGANA